MIDLLGFVSSCGDVVRYWELSEQTAGAVLRVRSRQVFATEQEASDAALKLVERLVPVGHELRSATTGARHDESHSGSAWRAAVEVVLGTRIE